MATCWATNLALLALTAGFAWAQPASVEVFGNVGAMRAGGDEGSLGSGAIYGGAITAPLAPKLAVDLDVSHGRTDRFDNNLRRTLISPSLLWRAGSSRVYGFAGGGLGVQIDRSSYTTIIYGPDNQPIREVRGESSNTGLTLHGRFGFVAGITEHLVVRTDVFLAFRYVLPNVGIKVGVGYRF